MKKIRDFLYHKASIKSILITAALLAAVAGTNFIIYFLKFLPLTGGTAYEVYEVRKAYRSLMFFLYSNSEGVLQNTPPEGKNNSASVFFFIRRLLMPVPSPDSPCNIQ